MSDHSRGARAAKLQRAGSRAVVRSQGPSATTRPNQTVGRDAALPQRQPQWVRREVVVILALTLLAYLPAIRAGYVWDDDVYVSHNATLRTNEGLRQIWFEPTSNRQYYPLAFTTFWLEYHLWGLSPVGYHATNIGLHAVNAVLAWQLLCRLAVPGALLAAATFAAHPMHVQSVAWISERKNVLSGMFYLLALLMWLRFGASGKKRIYALALLLFTGAMLSKTMACTLPCVLLILTWWKRPADWIPEIHRLLPFFGVAVACGAMTLWCESVAAPPASIAPHLSVVERALIAGHALWFYAGTLLWPLNLMRVYPLWEINPLSPGAYLYPLGVIAVLVLLFWQRKRLGRPPVVAVASYIVMAAPVLGFVNFNFMTFSYVADHLIYLPSIGLIALFAAITTALAQRVGTLGTWGRLGAGSALMLVLGAATWQQARLYENAETLWRDTAARNPQAWIAEYGVAEALNQRGALDEAAQRYRAALQLQPNFVLAQYQLGNILAAQGKLDEAIEHFNAAVRLRPDFIHGQFALGDALLRRGDLDAAAERFTAVLRANPSHAPAQYDLGLLFTRQRKFDAAVQHLTTAAGLMPNSDDVQHHLAMALVEQGALAPAIEHLSSAARLDPADADIQYDFGRTLAKQGDTDEAVRHLREAARLNPQHAGARFSLGTILAGQGRSDEAIEQFAAAVHAAPGFADAHNNWGAVLERRGDLAAAAEHYATALRIAPENTAAQINLRRASAQLKNANGPTS